MADLDQLYDALRKADAAGNAGDAKKLADAIRESQPRRSPRVMSPATGWVEPARKKGEPFASSSDDPKQVGLMGAMKSLDEGMTKAGGATTDWLSSKGVPAPVAGAAGTAVKMIPDLVTLPLGSIGGGAAARAGGVALQDIGKSFMQQAVKPTLETLKSGEAATAIDTMLKKGINPTHGGVEKLRDMIDVLNVQVKDAIASSVETVNKGKVGKSLIDTFNKFKNQVNPKADLEAIRKSWMEFRSHPDLIGKTEIPVQKAQELKQGTYDILRKKYGQLGSAETEAQKGLARGLKEGIAEKIPQIAGLNAEESKLIKTLNVAERRALMSMNNNAGGLAWLTTDPKKFAAFVADKSPLFKSLLARMMYSAGEAVAPAGKATGAGAGVSLYELGKQ